MNEPFRPRTFALTIARGFVMGSADLVPGVSGGTMAVVLGIYPRFIAALGSLTKGSTWRLAADRRFRDVWRAIDGTFLASLGLGIGGALVLLSTALHAALERRPDLLYGAFFGIIAASVWPLVGSVRGPIALRLAWAFAGAAFAWIVTGLPSGATSDAWWSYLLAGSIAITAMLLPGISGAFLLVVLGRYDAVLAAVSRLDLGVLVPFAAGLVVGLLSFSRVLAWSLRRFPVPMMSLLGGFLLGSLRKVWPFREEIDGGSVAIAPPDAGTAIVVALVAVGAAVVVTFVARRARSGASVVTPRDA